jgi:predicted CXXCH cytochrome family protein
VRASTVRSLAALLLMAASLGVPAPELRAADDEWAGSESCHTCHRGRFSSWHRTYHRTMTQEATPETVQGRFDGQPVTQWGFTVRPVREGEQFFFEYMQPDSDRVLARYPVDRTVGSHRYQQYLMRDREGSGNFYRLQILWHNGDQRWVHTNAAFLGPDDQQFDDQVSVWNNNCIFCHNTGPEPNIVNYDEMVERARAGEAVDPMFDGVYESKVAELGIACESCHGPAAAHVEKHSNWLTRAWYTVTGLNDDSIVNPDDLDRDAATQVCGQCHGQRLAKDVETLRTFIDSGPTYRPGGDLFESVDLVWPDSSLPVRGHELDFSLRFWPDGTPRLTAYEYQGLLMSPCHTESEMTCGSCHTMHDGDPAGMLPEEMRGNAGCVSCHQDLARDLQAHTHHALDTPGSNCLSCHMPEMVYGVMEIHRSHHIEVPDAAADAANARPNACTLCHTDRSLVWAEQETARLWGREARLVERADGLPAEVVDGLARLHAGDPVERAVMAVALGRAAERGQLEAPAAWRDHLLQALDDDYPAVRRFARRALMQIETVAGEASAVEWTESFDPLLLGRERTRALAVLMRRYAELAQDTEPLSPGAGVDVEGLRALGRSRSEAINIGE